MNRSTTTSAARGREHRRSRPPGPAVARRASGPVLPPRPSFDGSLAISDAATAPRHRADPRLRTAPQRPPLRLAAGGAATVALRVGETAMAVSGSRTMDRLVRSRAWIMIIGFGLIGIVAMQVSMLKLNAGIARATDTVTTLERSNQALKGQISKLSSGGRIQALAAQRGFSMPQPADVTYLRAGDRRSAAVRASRRMGSPDKALAAPAGSPLTDLEAVNPAGAAGVAAPATPAQASTAAATTAPLAQVPAAPAPAPAAPVTVPAGAPATAAVGTPATTTPIATTGAASVAGGAAPQTGVTLP